MSGFNRQKHIGRSKGYNGGDGLGRGGSGTNPADFFKMTINTGAPGVSAPDSFDLQLNSAGIYNFEVDWGDGNKDTITTWNDPALNKIYSSPGIYQISIEGTFAGVYYNNTGDRQKIQSIDQWGIIEWTHMSNAFYGCDLMTGNFTDTPDLSNVTSLFQMFRGCSLFNSDISGWDVSTITNVNSIFRSCLVFNQNLGAWDVSSVTSFERMFQDCPVFNNGGSSDIDNWDTSSATVMRNMFLDALAFNQPVGS